MTMMLWFWGRSRQRPQRSAAGELAGIKLASG
jgi:hypothetical protein